MPNVLSVLVFTDQAACPFLSWVIICVLPCSDLLRNQHSVACRAPELLFGPQMNQDMKIKPAYDSWAMATVLAEACTGHKPYGEVGDITSWQDPGLLEHLFLSFLVSLC